PHSQRLQPDPGIALAPPGAVRRRAGSRRREVPFSEHGPEGLAPPEARARWSLRESLAPGAVLRRRRLGHGGRPDVLCVVSMALLVHLALHPKIPALRLLLASSRRRGTGDRHRPALELLPQSAADVQRRAERRLAPPVPHLRPE